MDKTLYPADVNGEIQIPASKSQTIRALLIACFADGKSILHNPLISADTLSCVNYCKTMGAVVTIEEGLILVEPTNREQNKEAITIDCKNSGTTLFLGTALALCAGVSVTFTGDAQLQARSAQPLLNSLSELGARVTSTNGFAPYTISGPIKGGSTSIKCHTSQYLSALLLGCPLALSESFIKVPLLYEKPYVNITELWLKSQKIKFETNEERTEYRIPGNQHYRGFEATIAGDFSSASFFFCAAAITGGRVTVCGLDHDDPQGDKGILGVLTAMGCSVFWDDDCVTVCGPDKEVGLKGGSFDLNSMPDTLPALAVTACFATCDVRLENVPQARIKETDRIAVMNYNLTQLGADIEELEDGLLIHPVKALSGTSVNGFGDHRIIMAMSVASLRCEKELTILGTDAVDVTFPSFFHLFDSVRKPIIRR